VVGIHFRQCRPAVQAIKLPYALKTTMWALIPAFPPYRRASPENDRKGNSSDNTLVIQEFHKFAR